MIIFPSIFNWSFLALMLCVCVNQGISPPCESEIYCKGELLQTVQNAKLFNDSKTFVDMQLKKDPATVLAAFKSLGRNATKPQKEAFVTQNFDGPGTEFEAWDPTDWKSSIELFGKIKDPEFQKFGREIHRIWKQLGRKIKQDVRDRPERYSLVYSPHPFIIPGGRFREFYYWDSYWVIQGLLVSEMKNTVKGMLDNFLQIIEKFGFVPNGARVYYTRRSQPPFLIPMFEKYYDATNDLDFLRKSVDRLEEEYDFWMTNRTVDVDINGETYTLNRYAVDMQMPRPESYREDIETSKQRTSGTAEEVFSNLASGAESGFDFSSRWLAQEGDDRYKLHTIKTKSIIPVDLNSILCLNENILSRFYTLLGNQSRATLFKTRADKRRDAIKAVFWDSQQGYYFDWDTTNQSRVKSFSGAGVVPLYARCHGGDSSSMQDVEERVITYLWDKKILNYTAGVPTSLVQTGQQWDLPNAWPPLQSMLIYALRRSRAVGATSLAQKLTQKWLTTNYKAWKESGYIFEKYNVNVQGAAGRGGEYNVQIGFGWTNGVALTLLRDYGDILTSVTSSGRGQIIMDSFQKFAIMFSLIFTILANHMK